VAALALHNMVNADVYRRTLPDGTVEYSDTQEAESEKPMDIEDTTPGMIVPSSTTPSRYSPKKTSPGVAQSTETQLDVRINIASPADDTAIRDNSGNLTVTVAVQPPLSEDQFVMLASSAGAKSKPQKALSFTFTNLDRGTHNITAHVVNKSGKVISSSPPITIHLLRDSIHFPNQRRLNQENANP
jgi:hypothetical protein